MAVGTCSAALATEKGSATDPLIPQTVEKPRGKNSPGAAPGVANDVESAPKERQEQQKPKDFLSRFNAIFDDTTSTEEEKKFKFEILLDRVDVNLKNIYAQKAFVKMLNDIAKYEEDLKLFIVRFAAHNERIETKYLPSDATKKENEKKQPRPIINKDQRTMRDLDAPLHCAVRQLNEGFIEWLLEQGKTEVNLRNKQKETALAILCQKYDCLSKLKTRNIEKERGKADKKQQICLDDENIEESAPKMNLEKKMNAPTKENERILKLIKKLLKNGADFNIYMNDGALPFDFLLKYDTKADVAEIIKEASVKSNVAMTEISPKLVNASVEDKKKPEKRIVKFYKETQDSVAHVTVELLEIFIRFNNFEKFKYYWEQFKVTGDNVKKVITLLLHVAVKRNYTTYVEHIIKEASTEIFKQDGNKAMDIQVARSVTPERHHIRWCCFKCCQKRHYLDSHTQSEAIDLPVITPSSQDKYELISERPPTSAGYRNQNPSSSEVIDSQTQGETFKQEKHDTENSEDTCAGCSMKLSMNDEGSCKGNPSAPEGAEPQTQSGTSKLLVIDPHMESGTSKLKGIVPQMHSETIELQDNNPDSQDNHVAMTDGTLTSDEQPSHRCCLKCFQKKQNPPLPDGTNPRAQRQNSKDCRLTKAEENKMVHRTELKGLLKTVCLNRNIALLNMFLEMMNDWLLVNQNPLLINTLNGAYRMKQEKESTFLLECIKILINNHRKVYMYHVDKNGNTALHLALCYGYDKIALLMLKKIHGLIGFRNRQNKTPIECGTTEFWNTYLDSCISTNNDESVLRFNVGFLKPRSKDESSDISKSSSSKCPRCFKHVEDMKPASKYSFSRTVNDMTALCLISQSKESKEFLMHPVIIAFIAMKWKRLCYWNIWNLLLTAITMGTFIGYTLMACSPGGWKYGVIAGVGAFSIFFREIMQLFLLRWSYFTLENLVDILNVVFIGIVLECGCDHGGVCEAVPFLSSIVAVSLSLQSKFLLGTSWNNQSITLHMFKTISRSFFYSFLSFTPVIGAFIFSFHRISNKPSGISISNGTKSNSSEENFNNFHSAWDATIKTLVMTTGEFEAANINYDGGRLLLFVAVLFIAPIVILNLINGLARSDIAAIRQESEFISICRKVKLLERYERAIVEFRFKMPRCLQWLFRDPLLPSPFFENYESIIYVMLNEKNKLEIKIKDHVKKTKEAIPGFPWLPNFCLKLYIGIRSFQFVLYMSLDQSYVDKAKTIVRRQSKTNSGLGTSELGDAKQTDRPALVNKTAMNQHNTMALSRSTTVPSVPESRDKQTDMLQEQVRSMIAMLNDMQQQLVGNHATKTEATAS